ncbi:MAG: hypothetical protein EAZ85_02825 [Bacteroidetes bacterium]|nr:MAG: hypothetical protein EAZ85_02825 [Bacteroidota bacterium]TAG92380.1 MAG: hypothetical protein EAZ20_02560 [Bacteroidota bacterium]
MKKYQSTYSKTIFFYAMFFLTLIVGQLSVSMYIDIVGKEKITSTQKKEKKTDTKSQKDNQIVILEEMSFEAVMPVMHISPFVLQIISSFQFKFPQIITIGKVFSPSSALLPYFVQLFEHHIAPNAP